MLTISQFILQSSSWCPGSWIQLQNSVNGMWMELASLQFCLHLTWTSVLFSNFSRNPLIEWGEKDPQSLMWYRQPHLLAALIYSHFLTHKQRLQIVCSLSSKVLRGTCCPYSQGWPVSNCFVVVATSLSEFSIKEGCMEDGIELVTVFRLRLKRTKTLLVQSCPVRAWGQRLVLALSVLRAY